MGRREARLGAWLATDRGAGWAVFAATLAVYAATAAWTRTWNTDVQASVVPAARIAATGLPWLEGATLPDNPWFVEAGDHLVSNRMIGVIMLAVPFYLLAGAPELAVWPSALAAVTATAAGVMMLHLALRRLVRPSTAWAATAVFALGTPTWTVSANGLWSHTVTQPVLAAAAVAAARGRWWWAGVALGVGILARPHLAVIAFVFGLGVAWSRRQPRIAVAVGVPSMAGLALLLALNRWIYGAWTLSGYSSYVTDNLVTGSGPSPWEFAVNVAGFLVAPDRGLLLWTPLAALLLPAVWRARRDGPEWVVWLAAGGLAYTAVQLRINSFTGGDTFYGYRLALELVTCALPLYALGWARLRSPALRGVAAALAVVQVAVMALGSLRSPGWLSQLEVWTDNTVVYVIRQAPLVMGPLALVVLVLAARVGQRVARQAAVSRPAPAGTTRTSR